MKGEIHNHGVMIRRIISSDLFIYMLLVPLLYCKEFTVLNDDDDDDVGDDVLLSIEYVL